MSYLEYAHLPSGRRSRLATLTERAHGRIALLTLDHAPPPETATTAEALDPHHAFRLAAEAGFSAIATTIGLAETYHPDYAELLPLVLTLNAGPTQEDAAPALTATVEDAVRLDAQAVAFTLHHDHGTAVASLHHFQRVRSEAHRLGLPVLLRTRAHPATPTPSAAGDAAARAASTALELGADLVEITLPTPDPPHTEAWTDTLNRSLRAACATPVLVSLDGCPSPEEAARCTRAALDAGCAGITASHALWNRPYRDALQLAALLRDQLTT